MCSGKFLLCYRRLIHDLAFYVTLGQVYVYVCVLGGGGGKWMHSMYAEEFQHFKHLYFQCFTEPEAATCFSACKKALCVGCWPVRNPRVH